MRGAELSSDHHMIMTTLKLKLKKYPASNAVRKRYNVQTLQNKDVQGKFQISIANRFSALRGIIENETDFEKHWQHTKNIWHETCEETLGKKKSDHKEWIFAEIIQKLNLRKTKKEIINTRRTRAKEQLKRWTEHFTTVLNHPPPDIPPDITPAEAELQINIERPSKAEIKKATTALRNGKAAGPDEIPPEAIKADMETSVNLLHDLLGKYG
ncbi:hypothetical protein ElyMa_002704000 [Elysia marginata]|uniref:Endonuclease/exonuclease/phosphatase domain-containing protein n=1 Tax=Elysia marginata TaxID=1093978 RepID=A0AAV4HEF8_9GAST|nr:hypothetical protein ElyMa_002704000 [Elysia marginata]